MELPRACSESMTIGFWMLADIAEALHAALGFRFLANTVPRGEDAQVLGIWRTGGPGQRHTIPWRFEGRHGQARAGVPSADLVWLPFRGSVPSAVSSISSSAAGSIGSVNVSPWRGDRGEQTSSIRCMPGAMTCSSSGRGDATIKLAMALEGDFRRFCCHNPNLTISAGLSVHQTALSGRPFC